MLALAEFFYWTRKLQARFFAGDYAAAVNASRKAQDLLWPAASQVETGDFRFYAALALASAWDSGSAEERQEGLAALLLHHRQLDVWAMHCPENFESRAALVSAEIARIEGRALDAEQLYETAIRSAHDNGFAHCEGVANECAARFYLARGLPKIQDVYLRDARNCFLRWGANGKVKQLEEQHPQLRHMTRSTAVAAEPVVQLDVETIVKASQALSIEIVLPKLIEKLVRIAIHNAGAERGLLILIRGGDPRIEAEAVTAEGTVDVTVRQAAIAASSDLPQALLNYVLRTREAVLLDDASTEDRYAADPYVRFKRCRSVLCLPILNQAKLVGALYLENNLAPRVFTPERVAILQLLSAQAAISLENAALYSDLQLQVGLLQHLPVSAWTLMPDGTPDFVNQVWLDFAGHTLEFVRSYPEAWMTAIHPDDREIAAKCFWQGVHSGQGFAFENRSRRAKDQTYRWHLQQAVPLRDAEGHIV